VSTVPSGAADELADALAAHAGPQRLLFDVVYDPWPTPLAAAWEKRGGLVVSGLDLLVHQAAGQVRLMTGHEVPVAVLYAALS
jgi:shikimate dehydrogenase